MGTAAPVSPGTQGTQGHDNWTRALRERIERTVPAGQALPDRQPAYVASWIYVFGVLTLAALRRRAGLRRPCSPWAARPGGTSRRWGTS